MVSPDEQSDSGVTSTRLPAALSARYAIERRLGRGGMATVYLAKDRGVADIERHVALKVLHPHLAGEPDYARQLVREATIAMRIRHPHVVSVLDVVRHGEGLCLVMDYVDGASLAELMTRAGPGGLPLAARLRILLDALEGLSAVHDLTDPSGEPLGIVHRDFSPHNILVGKDGVARLTDFGIAKLSTATQHTVDGLIKGKLGYMSPEQARGRRVDQRSDVWAAGVIAWELIAERRLYRRRDEVSTLLDVATKTPPRLSAVVAQMPKELDDLIASALTREPTERCASSREFLDQMLRVISSLGGAATRQQLAEVVARACTRMRESPAEQTHSLWLDEGFAATAATASRSEAAAVPGRRKARTRSAWLGGALAGLITGGVLVTLLMRQEPAQLRRAAPALELPELAKATPAAEPAAPPALEPGPKATSSPPIRAVAPKARAARTADSKPKPSPVPATLAKSPYE